MRGRIARRRVRVNKVRLEQGGVVSRQPPARPATPAGQPRHVNAHAAFPERLPDPADVGQAQDLEPEALGQRSRHYVFHEALCPAVLHVGDHLKNGGTIVADLTGVGEVAETRRMAVLNAF